VQSNKLLSYRNVNIVIKRTIYFMNTYYPTKFKKYPFSSAETTLLRYEIVKNRSGNTQNGYVLISILQIFFNG